MTADPQVVCGAFAPGAVWVDATGAVHAPAGGWTLRWTVRADDRWRDPAVEVAVRRRGIAGGAGTEVALRVPSGDALVRTWVVPHGAGSVAVVEVENDSPAPFVVAVDLEAPGHTIGLRGADVVLDGRPALWSARAPREAEATEDGVRVAWPVPHRTSMRLLVPAHPDAATVAPTVVPGPEQAEAGWATIVDQGVRLSLPEPHLDELAAAAIRRMLLAAADPGGGVERRARLASGLAGAGHVEIALRLLGDAVEGVAPDGTVPGEGPAAGAALASAAGRIVELTADAALARALADPVVALAEMLVAAAGVSRRRRRRRLGGEGSSGTQSSGAETSGDGYSSGVTPGVTAGLAGAAVVLDAAGEPDAAVAARAAVSRLGGPTGPAAPAEPDELVRRHWHDGALAEPVGGDGARAASELITTILGSCVRDHPGGLELVPAVPQSWLGAPLEVYGVPTRHGRVSFAVRWHGERPALLWELDRAGRSPTPVSLRAPGLDPAWIDTRDRAEALLGPVSGTRLEAQPLRRGDESAAGPSAPDAPGEGESFS